MNTFITTVYRDLTCGAAATLITLMLGVTFIQATSVPPGMQIAGSPFMALPFAAVQPEHAWFGQPEPAVLVD